MGKAAFRLTKANHRAASSICPVPLCKKNGCAFTKQTAFYRPFGCSPPQRFGKSTPNARSARYTFTRGSPTTVL